MQEPIQGLTVTMPPRKIAYSQQSQQRWLADEVQALIQVGVALKPSSHTSTDLLQHGRLALPDIQRIS